MAKKLVALCACPMGLAHTFMAAEALEQAAKELGYDCRIETQGADGIKNPLSKQDLDSADIIIQAVAITPENNERLISFVTLEQMRYMSFQVQVLSGMSMPSFWSRVLFTNMSSGTVSYGRAYCTPRYLPVFSVVS